MLSGMPALQGAEVGSPLSGDFSPSVSTSAIAPSIPTFPLADDLSAEFNFDSGAEPAWDAALDHAWVAEFLGANAETELIPEPSTSISPLPTVFVDDLGARASASLISTSSTHSHNTAGSGLNQLARYLTRAWGRAGIPMQKHEDCSQAVFVQLLQNLGRSQFDNLVGEIDQVGIREVFQRESPIGLDFFRAVDTVKKRAQRERSYQSIDDASWTLAAPTSTSSFAYMGSRSDWNWGSDWKLMLEEAISTNLNPREAELIQATLNGETPAEIAARWGVAPKTVSNEKTRAIQKLREALSDED